MSPQEYRFQYEVIYFFCDVYTEVLHILTVHFHPKDDFIVRVHLIW
jgi:hypothetical protein